MADAFFSIDEPNAFEGPASDSSLSFRFYQPDLNVLGKRMEDHRRFAIGIASAGLAASIWWRYVPSALVSGQ